jgi:hypothetical protein
VRCTMILVLVIAALLVTTAMPAFAAVWGVVLFPTGFFGCLFQPEWCYTGPVLYAYMRGSYTQ